MTVVYISEEFLFLEQYLKHIKSIKCTKSICDHHDISFGDTYRTVRKKVVFAKEYTGVVYTEIHKETFSDGRCMLFLHNNNHTDDDVSFIIQGLYDETMFMASSCILFLFGTIIPSTWKHLNNFEDVRCKVKKNNYCNIYNVYYQVYTTYDGLKRCTTEYCVKTRCDELYCDWQEYLSNMRRYPHKLMCNNVYFYKSRRCVYHASDHIIGCHTALFKKFMHFAKHLLETNNIPRFIRRAEQVLTYCYLKVRNVDVKSIDPADKDYINQFMCEHYVVIPVKSFNYFLVRSRYRSGKITVSPDNIREYTFITPIERIHDV